MNITVIGRGNVGGGLASLWSRAGHSVQALGRGGGDASDAEVVVVAVPSGQIAEALSSVQGLAGQVAIDTTNAIGGRPEGYESLAHQVRSIVGGPTAKAFNTIFAPTYEQVGEQRAAPSCLWCGDDEAREVTERLVEDAGFDPVRLGGLEHAAALEDFLLTIVFPIRQETQSPFFYRIAKPGGL